MIVILDYGMGNPGSILNMIRKVGGQALITKDLAAIENSKAIILPGVGSFDNGMSKLRTSGMLEVLERKVLGEKKPFLGICLGMQLLFEKSQEGVLPGLNWIPGQVKRFDFSHFADNKGLKVPHMGWNKVNPNNFDSLFRGYEGVDARFYFVHSYHVVCSNPRNVLARCTHGDEFTCSVENGNIYGVQFHPEKSHKFGMNLFKNFLEIVKC